MGISPLANAELFCRSSEQRCEMQEELSRYLEQTSTVALPPPQAELLAMHAGEREPAPAWLDNAASKLQAQFLTVGEHSCYGKLSISSPNVTKPTGEDWELSEKVGLALIEKRLCHSVVLKQGCESKGFFGKSLSPALVASPDFAKLAILQWFNLLDRSGLPQIVDKLDSAAAHQRYCESKWQGLLAECKSDPRFAPVLAKSGR